MSKQSHSRAHGSATAQAEQDRTDRMEFEGSVVEALPGTLFKVKCGHGTVLCALSGKLRENRIRVLPGDNVTVEVSPYDVSRGRIKWRRS